MKYLSGVLQVLFPRASVPKVAEVLLHAQLMHKESVRLDSRIRTAVCAETH